MMETPRGAGRDASGVSVANLPEWASCALSWGAKAVGVITIPLWGPLVLWRLRGTTAWLQEADELGLIRR